MPVRICKTIFGCKALNNLDKFRAKVQTCKFWAETWAINVLERALNIKLIILSEYNFNHGDFGNVLQCGNMVDDDISKRRVNSNPNTT